MSIKISVCASALRPEQWQATYDSLTQNNIEWELIYAGPNPPISHMGSNFIYINSTVKPAQCYEIAFRKAQGELLHWTADDTTYPPGALDNMYKFWNSFQDNRIVAAFRTVEDGRDITEWHRLRGRDPVAPRMAPFGVVDRMLFNDLGGYDRRFVCGQSENDVVMRFYEVGGEVKISDIPVFVHHEKSHTSTVFRQGYYHEDRRVLEGSWIKDGVIQTKRLDPVERFDDKDITTITQSTKGQWA